ncbi:MAG: hypothetical protein IJY46_03385 [Lentisphaeria bacterium]|nr:hypothetical protein [Lentisphaeria bacterium]
MNLSSFKKRDVYKIKDYIKNLICNFYIAYKIKKCVAIPRKKAYYSEYSNFAFGKISFRFFMFSLDFLVENKYVSKKTGYKAFGGNHKSKPSKYWAVEKLYLHFNNIKADDIFSVSTPPIILKDECKNPIDFK